jgi:outer membrane protein assembly factor BamB
MTRRLVRSIAALALAGSLVVGGATTAAATGGPAWEQDGYGAGNTGYNPAEPGINAGSVGRLKLRWTVAPKPGTEGCADPRTPVIADGRMFIVDGDGVGAYDVRNGKLLWRDATVMAARIGRTLTIAGGLVITTGWSCFGMSNPSGHLAALDVRTGKLRWHVIQNDNVVSVVADRGLIIANAECTVCRSSSVTAYRVGDGRRMWSNDDDNVATGPVSAAGRLLLTSKDGGSSAVAVPTGRTLWTSPVRWSSIGADPAGGTFYATDPAGALTAINAGTGKVAWSVPKAAGPLAADGRRVFVARNGITGYDARTGKKLWGRPGTAGPRPIRAGGLLYASGGVLSPVTGATVAPRMFPGNHVVVVGGRLYATSGEGVIRAYTP